MTDKPTGAVTLRKPTAEDFRVSLKLGLQDFLSEPLIAAFFASFFVLSGLVITWITYVTGQTFWLVLAVLGFPLVGKLAAVGFYEVSRRRLNGEPTSHSAIVQRVWSHKGGQLPMLGAIIIVVFLFWFFLGHMIFALFLGLSPMTNVSTTLDVFLTNQGLMMIGFGSVIGAFFALLVFSMTVFGMPMLIDRDVDFMTALLRSMSAVIDAPLRYILWGLFIGAVTLVSMLPLFLGLFVTLPILGHATWHLYKRVSEICDTHQGAV